MGCNFYDLKGTHIGKRSAAGLYCWDCKKTLCKNGNSAIHTSDSEWFETCPRCLKTKEDEGWSSSIGRELGFNKQPFGKKSGVKSCSSFSWAIIPKELRKRKIKDEYGRKYSFKEFLKVLEECPIQFTNSIEERG